MGKTRPPNTWPCERTRWRLSPDPNQQHPTVPTLMLKRFRKYITYMVS